MDQVQSLKSLGISVCLLDITGKVRQAYHNKDDDEEAEDEEDAILNQQQNYECATDAKLEDVLDGRYEVLIVHPEALLQTKFGLSLLHSERFCEKVHSVIVDEAHTIREWGKDFRTAFGQLGELQCFFSASNFICLSATLTGDDMEFLKSYLHIEDAAIFRQSLDRPNIFYDVVMKPPSVDVRACAESVYQKELNKLQEENERFPVTLIYMPLEWMANAQCYAKKLFGDPRKGQQRYGLMFLNQGDSVKNYITQQLKLLNPYLRLVFCSSTIGMGFDSPCVRRVLHAKPPHKIALVQQTGRAGRMGAPSLSRVFYNLTDISSAIRSMTDEMREYSRCDTCLREHILSCFEFIKDGDKYTCGCYCCYNCKLSTCADLNHNVDLPN